MEFIAAAIAFYALLRFVKTPTPRKVFASISVGQVTERERGEQVQLTANLFEDESADDWDRKLKKMCEVHEKRTLFQNQRMLKLFEENKAGLKDKLKDEAKKHGLKAAPNPG